MSNLAVNRLLLGATSRAGLFRKEAAGDSNGWDHERGGKGLECELLGVEEMPIADAGPCLRSI